MCCEPVVRSHGELLSRHLSGLALAQRGQEGFGDAERRQ